jgi:hypothetical protein
MTNFSEQLAAAKAAPRDYRDVQVILDAGLSTKREQLKADLAAARAHAASDPRLGVVDEASASIQTQLDDLVAASAASLVTLRFVRMDSATWSDITDRCPARVDAPIDRQYGYNMNAACRLAAPLSGVRLDGDELVPLVVEKATADTPAVNEWADLFETISGHELIMIIEAIYELNMYEPARRVEQLKKELATRPA